MRPMRCLLFLLTILLVLPWGAYRPASAADGPARAEAPARPVAQITPADTQIRAVAETTDKKCRIAVLPGAPCNPDRGLLSETGQVAPAGSGGRAAPGAAWSATGLPQPPPRDPPRRS